MRFYIIILFLLLSFNSIAQIESDTERRGIVNLPTYEYEKIHFGFLIGFNTLDYHIYNTGARTIENNETAIFCDIKELNPGLNLGIVTDLRLCNDLNLRCLPGISFGQRDLTFIDEFGQLIDSKPLRIKSTFIEVPLLLKYSAFRIKNAKPFVVCGNTLRYDLAKDKQNHLNMKSFDCYLDAGAGFDFYLPYFRLSIELRASFGLRNIYNDIISDELEDIPYQQAIDCLKSRWYGITFYFE